MQLDQTDWLIIEATQEGLPLCSRPYHQLAEQLGLTADDVMQRFNTMLETGAIRRIGAVPNHYALGYRANGMTVWDVPDERIDDCGKKLAELDFVTHCYHRPRHLPDWSYNLFAMIHAHDHEQTEQMIKTIAEILGEDNRGHSVLYSTQILKKTGLRLPKVAA